MTINDFQLIHYLISIRSGVNELYEHETRSSSNCHNSSPYTAQTRVTEYAYKLSQLQKKNNCTKSRFQNFEILPRIQKKV